ncbi:MAG: helix-turn-helix transcriptional regulator, partial [Xanthobacteraceae bacterium]
MDKPTQREIAEKALAQRKSADAENALVFLRRADVQRVTGLPTSTLYDMIKRDEFPRPVKITEGGRVGWI